MKQHSVLRTPREAPAATKLRGCWGMRQRSAVQLAKREEETNYGDKRDNNLFVKILPTVPITMIF